MKTTTRVALTAIVGALLAAATVVACGAPDKTVPSTGSPAASVAVAPTPDTEAVSEFTKPFGSTIVYQSGLQVNVSQPAKFRPSNTAAGASGQRAISVKVTITNGQKEPFDTAIVQVNGTYNDIAAPAIFDSTRGIMGFPGRQLQPGKSISSTMAFSIENDEAGSLQVEVTPSFSQQTAVFTGNG